jgi:hypothetical protein
MPKGHYLWEPNIEVNKESPSGYPHSLPNGAPQATEKLELSVTALLPESTKKRHETPVITGSEPLVDKDLPLTPNVYRSLKIHLTSMFLLNSSEQLC